METTYHYEVSIFSTTYGEDINKSKPLSQSIIFKGENLLVARKDAYQYFNEKLYGLSSAFYVLPFASPKDFEFGRNSAISLGLDLVTCCKEEEDRHSLVDHYTKEETFEFEREIFSELGLSK